MVADVISQLEQRDGLLPLSIEDRPRLAALLAAHPELMGAIREAHALASRTALSAESVRLRVSRDPDDWDAGDYLAFELWAPADRATPARREYTAMLDRWIRDRAGSAPGAFSFGLRLG
jgi:hypothetical protein